MPCCIHFRSSRSLSPMPLYCFLIISNCLLVHFCGICCLSLLPLSSPPPSPSTSAAAVFVRHLLPLQVLSLLPFPTIAAIAVVVSKHHCHCLAKVGIIVGSSNPDNGAVIASTTMPGGKRLWWLSPQSSHHVRCRPDVLTLSVAIIVVDCYLRLLSSTVIHCHCSCCRRVVACCRVHCHRHQSHH